MTPEIWNDLRIRMRNLRADMLEQWAGDPDNADIGRTVSVLTNAIETWRLARPVEVPTTAPTVVESR